MYYVYTHTFQCLTVSSTTVKKWLLSSVVNEPTGPLNSHNVHCPINSATTEATAGHKFTYCLLMMHSWASRSRCCAWEACSDSSSGVVHPAEPRVASSWGPVTQTQGMESVNQPTNTVYPLDALSLCPHCPSLEKWSAQMPEYLANRLSITAVDFKLEQQSGGNWGLETWEQRWGQDGIDKGVKQHSHHTHWGTLTQTVTDHKHTLCAEHITHKPTGGGLFDLPLLLAQATSVLTHFLITKYT